MNSNPSLHCTIIHCSARYVKNRGLWLEDRSGMGDLDRVVRVRAGACDWWELLADYDVAHGRYWSFMLSSVFIAPLLWSWVLTGRQG